MAKEIGPKLAQLQALGRRRYEERGPGAPPAVIDTLREKVASIKPKPRKAAKKGKRK